MGRCCVPNCKGNYDNGTKVRLFSFPSDPVRKAKWQRAVRHHDIDVCHLKNFQPPMTPFPVVRVFGTAMNESQPLPADGVCDYTFYDGLYDAGPFDTLYSPQFSAPVEHVLSHASLHSVTEYGLSFAYRNASQVARDLEIPELFSESTASAMDFYSEQEDCKKFHGSAATSEFTRTLNKLFDCLNSRRPDHVRFNEAQHIAVLKDSIAWRDNWEKYNQALPTKRQVCFLSKQTCGALRISLHSSVALIESLLSTGFHYALVGNFGQDPLEAELDGGFVDRLLWTCCNWFKQHDVPVQRSIVRAPVEPHPPKNAGQKLTAFVTFMVAFLSDFPENPGAASTGSLHCGHVFSMAALLCDSCRVVMLSPQLDNEVKVHHQKIIEKSGNQALPWVRYIPQNGDNQLRTI
ncbi:hypothetical protein MRX96_057269 [Rhipicephalus microplus]